MFIFSLGFCVSFITDTLCWPRPFSNYMWPIHMRISLAQFVPKRNLLMALEVQQDIWNCSPTEGVSEGGYTVRVS